MWLSEIIAHAMVLAVWLMNGLKIKYAGDIDVRLIKPFWVGKKQCTYFCLPVVKGLRIWL